MSKKKVWLGSVGPYLYDPNESYPETTDDPNPPNQMPIRGVNFGDLDDMEFLLIEDGDTIIRKNNEWVNIQMNSIITLTHSDNPYSLSIEALRTFIICNASLGRIDIRLPDATEYKGREIIIKKIDSSNNMLRLDSKEPNKVEGLGLYFIVNAYDAVTIMSDGDEWLVISEVFGEADGYPGGYPYPYGEYPYGSQS